jgi:acyl carrier protein
VTLEVPPAAAIFEELRRHVATHVVAEGVTVDGAAPLAAMGIDSATLLGILLFLEQRFGVMVPDAELNRANLASLNALAACIHRLARGAG